MSQIQTFNLGVCDAWVDGENYGVNFSDGTPWQVKEFIEEYWSVNWPDYVEGANSAQSRADDQGDDEYHKRAEDREFAEKNNGD